MSRISGSQNFTPVSSDSADETRESSSSSGAEQICRVDAQEYSPVDTIEAHDDASEGGVHADVEHSDQEVGTPAYLSQFTGGRAAHESFEKEESKGEHEEVELGRSESHPEAGYAGSGFEKVSHKSLGSGKWEAKKESEERKSKAGEIEMRFSGFDKSSQALMSSRGSLKGEAGELNGEVNVGQKIFRGESSGSMNVKEGELAFHKSVTVGYDVFNARGTLQSHLGGVDIGASGDAMVGAELTAAGQAQFSLKEKKVNLAGGAAVTFASVDGKFKAEEGGVGVVGNARAELGFAARVSFDMEFKDGKLEVKGEEEVAVGVGESASAAVEIDAAKVREELGDAADKLKRALEDSVQDAVRSQIDDHFAAAVRLEEELAKAR